ncbi:hypothetical protein M3661_17665 [Paenibacillus sp. MER 180]|uniref:hypothetical protein n=1 Tax=Paenibacillus sp. MER 180 TaxID=2939570 RepID=UPI00203F8BD3|nr:hypothetical protein [Paenibacillus sp. MER 180]MCM3291952.1 hypothetical protein [Paenibacillus sp. MER 180]
MFHVCPLCNGMISPEFQCPNCLNPTTDSGKLEDYVGPYAPYQPDDSVSHQTMLDDSSVSSSVSMQCLHIIYCEHCQATTYVNGLAWE